MDKYGTFTFTPGNPIQLMGFSDGAAVLWSQNQDIHRQMTSAIEDMIDVFCDGTYPYENYYKYVEAGFLRGMIESESLNETTANWAGLKVVASLSALYRLDLDQDEGKIIASYLDQLKDHPSAMKSLTEIGVAFENEQQTEETAAHGRPDQTP